MSLLVSYSPTPTPVTLANIITTSSAHLDWLTTHTSVASQELYSIVDKYQFNQICGKTEAFPLSPVPHDSGLRGMIIETRTQDNAALFLAKFLCFFKVLLRTHTTVIRHAIYCSFTVSVPDLVHCDYCSHLISKQQGTKQWFWDGQKILHAF